MLALATEDQTDLDMNPSEEAHQGILLHKTEELTSMVANARKKGFRLEIHCIGDRAAEQVRYDTSTRDWSADEAMVG